MVNDRAFIFHICIPGGNVKVIRRGQGQISRLLRITVMIQSDTTQARQSISLIPDGLSSQTLAKMVVLDT